MLGAAIDIRKVVIAERPLTLPIGIAAIAAGSLPAKVAHVREAPDRCIGSNAPQKGAQNLIADVGYPPAGRAPHVASELRLIQGDHRRLLTRIV